MKLSIIIPAFNEEKELPLCLTSVEQTLANADADFSGWAFETIVVDNNSTDATGQIGRDAGVKVVFEPVNQIAGARNAGAAVADGDWLLFIDADSRLHAQTLRETLAAIETDRYVAGGCIVAMDPTPWWGAVMLVVWNTISRTMRWAAGSYLFCRADAFNEIEGFSDDLYAAEEIDLSQRLKRWGKAQGLRMTILTGQPHLSSGRKFELYSKWEMVRFSLRGILRPLHSLRSRKRLDYFYDGRR
jgi:glycosyltransferase involved in cell wall biosynthesis